MAKLIDLFIAERGPKPPMPKSETGPPRNIREVVEVWTNNYAVFQVISMLSKYSDPRYMVEINYGEIHVYKMVENPRYADWLAQIDAVRVWEREYVLYRERMQSSPEYISSMIADQISDYGMQLSECSDPKKKVKILNKLTKAVQKLHELNKEE